MGYLKGFYRIWFEGGCRDKRNSEEAKSIVSDDFSKGQVSVPHMTSPLIPVPFFSVRFCGELTLLYKIISG